MKCMVELAQSPASGQFCENLLDCFSLKHLILLNQLNGGKKYSVMKNKLAEKRGVLNDKIVSENQPLVVKTVT